jgi:hypothetical protein
LPKEMQPITKDRGRNACFPSRFRREALAQYIPRVRSSDSEYPVRLNYCRKNAHASSVISSLGGCCDFIFEIFQKEFYC